MSDLQQTDKKPGDIVKLRQPISNVYCVIPANTLGEVKRVFAGLLGVHFPEFDAPEITHLSEKGGAWTVDLCDLVSSGN